MSNVTLKIGGRSYTVSCADGEEAHVTDLGEMINAKVTAMQGAAGSSEARALLFAALMLADEVMELRQSGAHAPAQAAPATPPAEPAFDPALAERLTTIARRIENLAETIEVAS